MLAVAAAGALWAAYSLTAPRIPSVTVTVPTTGQGGLSLTQAPWQPSIDGRPAQSVVLTVNAYISATGRPDVRTTVLGITGPGIHDSSTSAVNVAPAHGTPWVLAAALDCSQVHFPVHAVDYRIRIRVIGGSRSTTGSIPGGAMSSTIAAAAEQACGSWLARRDLTVVRASAIVDAVHPNADITLVIDNKNLRPAYLDLGRGDATLTVTAGSPRQTVLAGGATSTLHLHVAIGDCGVVPTSVPSNTGNGFATTSDYLGIVALVGSQPAAHRLDTNRSVDGEGPTGIVVTPTARSAIEQALRSACADLNQFVTLIAPRGITFDRQRGLLTVRINIDGTPGSVHDVLLVADPAASDAAAFRPQWSTIRSLVPDPNGQVTTTLLYRVPSGSACPSQGAWIPGFILIAHAPVAGHVKTLRYAQFIDPSQDRTAMSLLCPGATPVP